MHDEVHDAGMIGAAGDVPGLDPMQAVNAVAGPRGEAARGDGGFVVETTVRVDGEAQPPETNAVARKEDPALPESDRYGEFTWPDGYVTDPQALAKFIPLAKRLGLDQEAAQELATLYAELDAGKNRAQAEFIARNNAEWLREIQSHPEFGGHNLQRSGEEVAATLRRYGSPLLLAQIRQMNVQNWPEMFYFLARVSRAVSEDCSPAGSDGAPSAKSTAQLLFPGLK